MRFPSGHKGLHISGLSDPDFSKILRLPERSIVLFAYRPNAGPREGYVLLDT
jgi:hypothetical protein